MVRFPKLPVRLRRPAPAFPKTEVMFDQLSYLVDHAAQGCQSECSECIRLNRVKSLLLLPFQSELVKEQLPN